MTQQAAPEVFNWLTAVWIPLGAATLGGILSAAGAVVAIGWQGHEQRKTRDRAAIDLFDHLLKEQARFLTQMGEYRSSNAGQFSFIDADKLQANYQTFERNREWLVWLKDEVLRSRVADTLSEIQIWVTVVRNLAGEQQHTAQIMSSTEPSAPEWAAAKEQSDRASGNVNQLFADLPRQRNNCQQLAISLGSRG